MEYPIGVAKSEFSRLLREAHQAPVIITRRGQPDVVLLALREFDITCLRLTEGQYLDMSFENRLGVTVDEYMAMINRDTLTRSIFENV